ncbi:hypothetical protein [Pseudomonas fluorescens]|uniref:hypothetical protein n=1 Tax=Pseudomonas fluorescens TaxID=294 RepID=UPI00123F52B4|nr:hypothetical protein [Pseudomonas fluorescens]VVM95879.1 hypothetical protein PS676_03011 [Pseudomonas fluorescens]
MSSLLFYMDANEVIVATDTLLHYPAGSPPGSTSKAIALPHLRMIIAATGAAALFNRWIGLVNEQGFALDVDTVDVHTPETLQSLWRELNAQLPALHQHTATIYHFGFSDNTGNIHGFAYRSESNFASEKLDYGLGLKPDLMDKGGINLRSFPDSAPEIMQAQILQENKKAKDRVYIGGTVQINHLARDGFSIYSMGDLS